MQEPLEPPALPWKKVNKINKYVTIQRSLFKSKIQSDMIIHITFVLGVVIDEYKYQV